MMNRRVLTFSTLLCAGCVAARDPGTQKGEGEGGLGGGGDGGGGSTVTLEGAVPDEGLGLAVACGAEGVWVGAPHGEQGRVYRVEGEALVDIGLVGERSGGALALVGGQLWIGEPLAEGGAGRIRGADGAVLAQGRSGDSLGLALESGGAWALASGWARADGSGGSTPGRPTALASAAGVVGVGMARGAISLVLGELQLPRQQVGDEAGYALAAGDFDGDGDPEWALGAPGLSEVRVLDSDGLELARISGEGRLGAALSAADWDGDGRDELLVGAPLAGGGQEGEVSLWSGADWAAPVNSWSGARAGGQLGAALCLSPGLMALGEPGAPGETGRLVLSRD